MQAAAYMHPDGGDYSSYSNIPQSQLLRFAIAAAWFLVLGIAQVTHHDTHKGLWLTVEAGC